MQNLLNALINGTVEYKDDGVQISVQSNAIMLRAARTLKQLLETNETNNLLIQQMQAREAALLIEIDQFRVQQRDLYNQLTIKEQNERNQSVRNAEPQASDVDGGQPELRGGNSLCENGSANTDGGLCTS